MHNDSAMKVSENALISKPLMASKSLGIVFFGVSMKTSDSVFFNRNRNSNILLFLLTKNW